MNFLLKRSGAPDKRPDPTSMALGELDLNYDDVTGGVFYKDSNGGVVKVGSAQVSATAPNATPAGSAGNSTGEFWYDTAAASLKVWNGTSWVAANVGLTGITNSTTTALGVNTLDSLTSGSFNTAVGIDAGTSVTSGSHNTFVGYQAGDTIATGNNNTIIGSLAYTSASAFNNSIVGYNAGQGMATSGNSILGASAASAASNNASAIVAIGQNALMANTLGVGTVAVGAQSLSAMTQSTGNVAVGYRSGVAVTTGGGNTLIGHTAGDSITTGANNTIIGDISGSTTLTGNLILAAGTTIKLQVNENGAVGVGSTPAYGSAGQILMSNGTGAAPTWTTSAGLLPNYGEFLSTVGQTNLDTTNGNAATFNTTVESRNVSIVNNSQVTFAAAGTYNIQISLMASKSDSGTDSFYFWFKKNGTTIANSGTEITLQGNGDTHLASLNFIITAAANDYVELWWYSIDANTSLSASAVTGPVPLSPSIILTAVPVGA